MKTTNLTSRDIQLDDLDFDFDSRDTVWDFYTTDENEGTRDINLGSDRALGTLSNTLKTALFTHFDLPSSVQEALEDFFELSCVAPNHENYKTNRLVIVVLLCWLYYEGTQGRANTTKAGAEVTESYLYSYILDMNHEIETDATTSGGAGYDYEHYLSYDYGDTGLYSDDPEDFFTDFLF